MPSRVRVAAFLLLALAARVALADAPAQSDEPPKSPAIALGWSLGLTAAGGAIILGGVATDRDAVGLVFGTSVLFFGPAAGRAYAGGNIVPGLLIRGATGLGALLVIQENILQCTDECAPGEDSTRLAVYDVVRAPLDAREFNRAHDVVVAPTLAGEGAALAPGIAISGAF